MNRVHRKKRESKGANHSESAIATATSETQAQPKHTLVEVASAKWKELLVGGIIGWILSTAAFFIKPYSDFLMYRVAGERQPFGKPTLSNLTGDWSITIEQKSGVFDGALHLVQRRKKLSGDYLAKLNGVGNYRGAVLTGDADEAVTLELMWDSGNCYWSIVGAEKKEEDNRINLRSTSVSRFERCGSCPSGFERKEDGIKFHAVAERY